MGVRESAAKTSTRARKRDLVNSCWGARKGTLEKGTLLNTAKLSCNLLGGQLFAECRPGLLHQGILFGSALPHARLDAPPTLGVDPEDRLVLLPVTQQPTHRVHQAHSLRDHTLKPRR